jgi:regulatory protein
MTVRLEDPEARLQHARDVAWTALNRRERTVTEMARLLAAKRVEPAAIETVLAELGEQGYLDDASYAQRFAEDRRRLDAWGAERIERKLLSLGIDRELIAAAIGAQDGAGEMEAALELLARRFPDAARSRPGAGCARPQGLRARAGPRRAAPARRRARRAVRLTEARPGSSGRSRSGFAPEGSQYYDPAKRQTGPRAA